MPNVRPLFTASVTSEADDNSKLLFLNSNLNESGNSKDDISLSSSFNKQFD